MNRTIFVLSAVLLSSCAVVEPAVFRDPASSQIHQCTSTSAGGFFPLINAWTAQHEIDTCAASYSRMGWVRQ